MNIPLSPPTFDPGHDLQSWYQQVVDQGWHGLHFQHAALCPRRAWFCLNRMQAVDERMRRGIALHEQTHSRDRSVEGLIGLAPDRIDWQQRIVFEHKGRWTDDEGSWAQVEFYGWFLQACTNQAWSAVKYGIDQKKKKEIVLDLESWQRTQARSRLLMTLVKRETPPRQERMALCDYCSFKTLCGYDGPSEDS